MYHPAHGKQTFYNSLRQYDQKGYGFGHRQKSHTATMTEKRDMYAKTQNHFNPKFKREMALVRNYQHMMDHRLSKPKGVIEVEGKIYKNSYAAAQRDHQTTFYRSSGSLPKMQRVDEECLTPSPIKKQQPMSPNPTAEMCRSFTQNYTEYPKVRRNNE